MEPQNSTVRVTGQSQQVGPAERPALEVVAEDVRPLSNEGGTGRLVRTTGGQLGGAV